MKFTRCPIRTHRLAAFILTGLLLALSSDAQAKKGAYAADPSNFEMVEAPTAYTLLHGGYSLGLRMYEGGGVLLRADIGFHRFLQVGFSGNATNLVGHGDITIQEPRVAIKLKPFSQSKKTPVSWALGWDDRGYGLSFDRRFSPGLQKGIYTAISREFREAGNLQVHAGMNVVRPGSHYESEIDLGAFGGISFAVSHAVFLSLEADKLLTDFWQFNSGALFNLGDSIRMGMDFREMNRSERFARILRIQYLGFF